MKVLFIISSLDGGGAERIVSFMSSFWAKKGWNSSVLTLSDNTIRYPLDKRVNFYPLNMSYPSSSLIESLCANIRRISKLRKKIREINADVIIAFMEPTTITAILAAWGTGIPVLVADRIDPKFYNHGKTWRFLRNITYPFGRYLVVQTQNVVKHYPIYLRKQAVVIPNLVWIKSVLATSEAKEICSYGRLVHQKGFDVLIRAFAGIADEYPDWNLVIWGEGSEKENLKKLVKLLGLNNRVSFPGFGTVHDILNDASIFVLSSRYEGFPNTLLEAMAYGLPVISTDCPSGPNEIVKDGETGLLVKVDNIQELQGALRKLIDDPVIRKRMGEAASADVMNRFHPAKILARWEELIKLSLSSRNRNFLK